MSEIAKIKLIFRTRFSVLFRSSCSAYNYYLQKQIVIFAFSLKRQLRIALIMLCASCARSWVECQHLSGGESWPYVVPHSFTAISLCSCCRAHSLSICDLTGQSPISFAAACLFPWWTPLPPGHSIQPTILQVKCSNHSRCVCLSPQLCLPCLALLHLLSLWGSWGALIDHFLPVFPQKSLPLLHYSPP